MKSLKPLKIDTQPEKVRRKIPKSSLWKGWEWQPKGKSGKGRSIVNSVTFVIVSRLK